MKREILGTVLCGGASSRMGADKAALSVRSGLSQLDYSLQLLGSVCLRLAVAGGGGDRVSAEGAERIEDASEAVGPMAGVIGALRSAAGWPVFALACDMPYLEASHVVQLANRRDASKIATCFVSSDGRPEPLCAIYEPSSLDLLEAAARQGRFSLRRFLRESAVELVAASKPDFLASVNDPESLEAARKRLS